MNKMEPNVEFSWPQLAKILFEAQGIKSGLWQLAVKLRFAALNMQLSESPEMVLDPAAAVPSSVTALEGLALFPASQPGPMVFDAASLLAPPVALTKTKAPKKVSAKKVTEKK